MSTTVFESIIQDNICIVKKLLAESKKYQPTDPFYAFRLMDDAVHDGVQPVCVILGQDPYPQKGVPTGVAFANNMAYLLANHQPSPSLAVIIDSLKRLHYEEVLKSTQDSGIETFDVSLVPWIKQGILPINSALTVEPGRPGSHSLMWAKPMADIIVQITNVYPDLCWIMLGSQAALFKSPIPSTSFVLFDNHPSWYARTGTDMPVRVWKEAKKYCKEHFNKEIHWLG